MKLYWISFWIRQHLYLRIARCYTYKSFIYVPVSFWARFYPRLFRNLTRWGMYNVFGTNRQRHLLSVSRNFIDNLLCRDVAGTTRNTGIYYMSCLSPLSKLHCRKVSSNTVTRFLDKRVTNIHTYSPNMKGLYYKDMMDS